MGLRFFQREVVADMGYQGTVEASAMRVAYEVLQEDPATPGHEQRMGVARALFQGLPDDITRFVRLFAWYAVFDPHVQTAVYNAETGEITPQNLNDEHMDGLVREFWDVASDYREPPAEEGT